MTSILSILAGIIIFTAFLSCKKSGDSLEYGQGVGACRLTVVNQFSPDHPELVYSNRLSYNESNQLTKYVYQPPAPYAPAVYGYSYSSNQIFLSSLNTSGQLVVFDTILLNASQQPYTRRYSASSQNIGGHYLYHYDVNGNLHTDEIIPDTDKPFIEYYKTWIDGDLIKDSSSYYGVVVQYTYDQTRPAQIANYWRPFLSYTGSYPTSRHLLTSQSTVSQSGPPSLTGHKYGYDSHGKIAVDSFENGSIFTFEYECH